MTPTFACYMGNPWTPYLPLYRESPVITQPMRCEHCFCTEAVFHWGEGTHLICCHCGVTMAEKFVQAWFKILAPATSITP